jgi:hypothetical protein
MAYVVRNFDLGFVPNFNTATFDNNILYKGTLLIGELPVVFTERKSEDAREM